MLWTKSVHCRVNPSLWSYDVIDKISALSIIHFKTVQITFCIVVEQSLLQCTSTMIMFPDFCANGYCNQCSQVEEWAFKHVEYDSQMQ